MGGSGGGYSGMSPKYWDQLNASEREVSDTVAAQVDQYLGELLAVANSQDRELMRSRLDDIQRVLAGRLEVQQLLFGGSVAKRTAVEGISDVDALVLLNPDPNQSQQPQDILRAFTSELRSALGDRDVLTISSGDMAVTVKYRDGQEVQLLPAIRRGEELVIGHTDGQGWRQVAPRAFGNALTNANQQVGGNLVPVIKLYKVINAGMPSQKQLTGYHIEALAVESVKGYEGPCTPKALLSRFLESSANKVLGHLPDVTKQSPAIDSYLGAPDSNERRNVAQTLLTVKRRMDAARSPSDWKSIFGE